MSGRRKGGKGMGVFRPRISETDARSLILDLLPKTYHSVLKNQDATYEVIHEWLVQLFSENDDLIIEARENIPSYLTTKNVPNRIRINKTDIKKIRPKYEKALEKYIVSPHEKRQENIEKITLQKPQQYNIPNILQKYNNVHTELGNINKELANILKTH